MAFKAGVLSERERLKPLPPHIYIRFVIIASHTWLHGEDGNAYRTAAGDIVLSCVIS